MSRFVLSFSRSCRGCVISHQSLITADIEHEKRTFVRLGEEDLPLDDEDLDEAWRKSKRWREDEPQIGDRHLVRRSVRRKACEVVAVSSSLSSVVGRENGGVEEETERKGIAHAIALKRCHSSASIRVANTSLNVSTYSLGALPSTIPTGGVWPSAALCVCAARKEADEAENPRCWRLRASMSGSRAGERRDSGTGEGCESVFMRSRSE